MNKKQIEQPVGRILAHLGRSFLTGLNKKLSHLDIERNYYALLLIGNAEGNITQQELAQMLDTDKVTVVRIVDYLSQKGYIKRVRDLGDRRKYNLVITAKASKEIGKISSVMAEITTAAFKNIAEAQKKAFYQTLEQLSVNINEYNKAL